MPRLKVPCSGEHCPCLAACSSASRTRSAYVAFVVFLAIGFIYGKRLPVRKLVLPLAALAFSVFLMDALSSTTDYLVRERESIQTMSDRIPLWEHLTSVVMREAPITGLGYYAASRVRRHPNTILVWAMHTRCFSRSSWEAGFSERLCTSCCVRRWSGSQCAC